MGLFSQFLCVHHHFVFIRNIYGDEINLLNARSIYRCDKCGKYTHRNQLNTDDLSPAKPIKSEVK